MLPVRLIMVIGGVVILLKSLDVKNLKCSGYFFLHKFDLICFVYVCLRLFMFVYVCFDLFLFVFL